MGGVEVGREYQRTAEGTAQRLGLALSLVTLRSLAKSRREISGDQEQERLENCIQLGMMNVQSCRRASTELPRGRHIHMAPSTTKSMLLWLKPRVQAHLIEP